MGMTFWFHRPRGRLVVEIGHLVNDPIALLQTEHSNERCQRRRSREHGRYRVCAPTEGRRQLTRQCQFVRDPRPGGHRVAQQQHRRRAAISQTWWISETVGIGREPFVTIDSKTTQIAEVRQIAIGL